MKNSGLKYAILLIAFISLSSIFFSCDDDEPVIPHYVNALVTAKTDSNGVFYLQLDDNTTLFPVNVQNSPYVDKEMRALANYYEVRQDSYQFSKAVFLNWLDSIRTKNTVPNLGNDNDKTYGSDPVEIVKDWVTIAEDGYLTLRFRTLWGFSNRIHYVNLVTGVNPDNPYEVEFHHNANGDYSGSYGDGLVAFNLKDLPDTEGNVVKLKLKWKSFSGPKSTEFNYCSRKSDNKTILQLDDENFTSDFK